MNVMTVRQAAELLGLSERGVLMRIERGDLRADRLGARVWAIPRKEVERWQAIGKLKPGPKPRPQPARSKNRPTRHRATPTEESQP